MDIADQITAILADRHHQLPTVRDRITRWTALDQQLAALSGAFSDPNTLKLGEAGPDRFTEVRLSEARAAVADVLERLRALEARFARSTVNIGVSGSARVGKSTMLQAISGLDDRQVPTGTGIPVTAVRSRIYHSASRERALVSLHTFETFRRDVLEPFHAALRLPVLPESLAAFRTWTYPARIEDHLGTTEESPTLRAQLTRLREIHRALPTYEQDLVGGEREVSLANLRQYVAYPTVEEREAAGGAHRYLAVREVMIECPFPNRQVDQLGLLDLPGLGEVDANADTRHVAGLRGEVDVVVMVLRPAEGIAYWRDVDNGALELLKEVRGGIGSARDFVFLAINDAEPDRVRLAGLRQSITSLANDETPDVHYRVLEADAHCPGDVHGRILAPVLLHLAERLPTMDREVFAAAIAGADTVLARIRTAVEDLETALRVLRQRVGVNESLHGHASRLRAMLAIELRHIVDDLRRQAEESAEDTEFVETLERTFDETVEWIQDGFGVGAETWTRRAFEDMAKLGNASAFAVDELNFIRVDISRRFAGLSDLFAGRVQAVWGQVAEALRRHLGVLLADADRDRPDEALRRFVELLNDAEEPCPTLAQAVSGLLDVRIDYQSQLYPRVRAALASLNQEIKNPATGEVVHQTAVEISEGGAEQLYTTTSRLAERAAHQAKRALLAESIAPTMILYAVVEHFADHLIRSRESEGEFRRLARSYRDDIWPAEFHQIGEANARVTRLRAAVREIASTLAELEKSL